jgi:glycosyltransferase involved in cell wall biosynthesis
MNNSDSGRIGFVNSSRSWGGGEKWHFEAAEFLQQQGYNVVFFCEPGSAIEQRLTEAGIRTENVRISNLSFLNPFKRHKLATRLRKLNVRTLILNSPADVKTAGPAARTAGVEKIIFRRGMPHRLKNNALNRWLFTKVITLVVANSQSVAATLSSDSGGIVAPDHIIVIENGMNFDAAPAVKPLLDKSADRLVLGSAGRMVPQKNQKILIDVAERLRIDDSHFLLVIAGTGELENELQQEAERRGLQDWIHFPGFINNMHALFAITDIFVFPSLYEGSPNTIIEAAGAGLPVIASDIPPNREILWNESLGRLVPVDDVDAYCTAIRELAQNATLRSDLGQAAQTEVRARFNLKQTRDKLLTVI